MSDQNISSSQTTSSLLEGHKFVPIPTNWRKKYYSVSFKKRLYAYLLDSLFVNIFILLLAALIGGIDTSRALVLASPFFVLYLAISESSNWKGTLGKLIMKIQISDLDGNAISFCRSIFRNILKSLVFYSYFLVIPLILQIWSYNKTKKLFHDHLSSTLIGVRLPKNPSKPKIPLNKKLIFQLSLAGIILALIPIYWPQLSANMSSDIILYLVYFNIPLIILAFFISKKSQGKYAQHGFIVALLMALWILVVQFILIDRVEVNYYEFVATQGIEAHEFGPSTIVTGGIFNGLFAGFLLGFYSCLFSETTK